MSEFLLPNHNESSKNQETSFNTCSKIPNVDSYQKLSLLLSRHPYLQDRLNFVKQMRRAHLFLSLIKAQKKNSKYIAKVSQIALKEVSKKTICGWLTGKVQPRLFRILSNHEMNRIKHEAALSPEAQQRRVDSSIVYRIFRPIVLTNQINSETVAVCIEELYRTLKEPLRVFFAEFYPYHQNGPKWLTEIAVVIKENRIKIEKLLNSKLQSKSNQKKIRIGLIDKTLYVWHQDINPDNWLNFYANERFYFHSRFHKIQLINEARRCLGIRSDISLGRLIGQVTDYQWKIPSKFVISDLIRNHNRLSGETLRFLLNVTNLQIKDVQSRISYIGKGHRNFGRILNPNFLPIEPFRTRLLAIMLCDGHLNERRCLHYKETDPQRRAIVKSIIMQIGDVEYRERSDGKGNVRIDLPAVFGRLLERWGMPVGDRALQNKGLPSSIMTGSLDLKQEYLKELIPEEGSFNHRDFFFKWRRTAILVAGNKGKKYNFTRKINESCVNLILKFGKSSEVSFGGKRTRTVIRLLWGKLQKLKKSSVLEISRIATDLENSVLNNPPKLLEDEIILCRKLGIQISCNPVVINLFESNRISVAWYAVTASISDSIRWALLAPPNDIRKRRLVERNLDIRKAKGLSLD